MTCSVPALIDCHVHFRDPGLTHKGDMQSEATAAFYGGISVALDMPNTIPPTQTVEALAQKIASSERCREFCDIRFFFGATAHSHLSNLKDLFLKPELADLRERCCGLKLYLDNSTGDMKADESVVQSAFQLCAELGLVLVAHCEDSTTNQRCCDHVAYRVPSDHSARRPPESETASIRAAIRLAAEYGTRLHIAHLSTADGVVAVRDAKSKGLPVTCEVTPHHLFLTLDDYESHGANVKVNPPVRSRDHRDALWRALADGTVDCVATDHAPHLLEEKMSSENPPSGIPGVELVVPLLLTAIQGVWPHPTTPPPLSFSTLRFSVDDLVRWMHVNPKKIFGLSVTDAPTTTLLLNQRWTVEAASLHSKVKWSPYDGWQLMGRVLRGLL